MLTHGASFFRHFIEPFVRKYLAMTPTTTRVRTASGSPSSGGAGAEPLPVPVATGTLDKLETSSRTRDFTGDDDDPIAFRNPDSIPWEHRGWQPVRRRVFAAMCRTDQSDARKHAFWHCRDRVHVVQSPSTGEVEAFPETCHDRFCLPCGQIRSRKIAQSVEKLMRESEAKLLFVTLTLRGTPQDRLSTMLGKLRDAWKALRRLDGWKNAIKGGVVMTEIKWSTTSGGHWHPHYHIIAEGRWLDEKWLENAWKVVTRDSDQVKVKRVRDPAEALSYVTKYASKPMDASFTMKSYLLDEAMIALKGTRLAACFGTWHGTPLNEQVEATDETAWIVGWIYHGTTSDLEVRAVKGDAEAIKLLATVERLQRLRHTFTERCRGPSPGPESHPKSERAA